MVTFLDDLYYTSNTFFFQLNSMHETQGTLNETYMYATMKDNVPLTERQLLLNIDSFLHKEMLT